MRLKRLQLHRLPGFKIRGFALDEGSIGPQVNIVIGPNASGKSSICQAIRKLLWPELEMLIPAWIESCWEWQGREELLSIEGNRRIGGEALSQKLPDQRVAKCFSISIDDLFAAEDVPFAQKISEAMSGGYSLDTVIQRIAPGSGAMAEVLQWREAQQVLRHYELEQKALRYREEKIPQLQSELDSALRCNRALASLEKQNHLVVEVHELREKFAVWQALTPPTDTELSAQHQRLDQLFLLKGQQEQLLQEIEQKESSFSARNRLLGMMDPAAVASLHLEELFQMQQLWQQREEAKQRAAGIEAQLASFPQHQEVDARKFQLTIELLYEVLAQRALYIPVLILAGLSVAFYQNLWGIFLLSPLIWWEWRLRDRYRALEWTDSLPWEGSAIRKYLENFLTSWGLAQVDEGNLQQKRMLTQSLEVLQEAVVERDRQLQERAHRAGISHFPESIILFSSTLRDLHSDWVDLERLRAKLLEVGERTQCQEVLWSGFAKEWGEESPLRGAFERIQMRVLGVRTLKTKEKELNHLQEEIEEIPQDAKAQADRIEDIRKELADLQAEIRHAERANLGQQLREKLSSTLHLVTAAAQLVTRKELTLRLIERLLQTYRQDYQPTVVKRAAYWFQQFTHNQFLLAAEGGSFEAIEVATGERKSMEQLSRGTRMQLLLAVRLAFALEQESTELKMPLFLDEILANSDPQRFDLIVQQLVLIAREGRQIFYFTCNPEEVWRWRAACPEAVIIDLRQIQERQAFLSAPIREPSQRKVASPKKDQSLFEYARDLSIPNLCPKDPIEMASVYYLANSSTELYQLLSGGICIYGQWKQVDSKAWAEVVDILGMARRGEILEKYLKLKNQGRGFPLTRETLIEGGVTSSFIDRLWEVAKSCDCHADRFLERLEIREDERVRRLQKKAIESLREFLFQKGYVDERPKLDEEAIRRELFPTIEKLLGTEQGIDYFLRITAM